MKIAVIVDGYSGGVHIAPQLKEEGYQLYHVQSDTSLWDFIQPQFNYKPFHKNFDLRNENKKNVFSELKKLKVDLVLPGTETGVELADEIRHLLGLNNNELSQSAARRNKFLMLQACQEKELLVPHFQKVHRLDEAFDFFVKNKKKRVVLKPLNSAGTDGVYFCDSKYEIEKNFFKIIGTTNRLGIVNEQVLISEFMKGEEYFINTVSHKGQVQVTDIWRYHKRRVNGFDAVYDYNDLCDYRCEREQQITTYALRVLKALGVHQGPAHIEVMMTEEGPKLVELGARLDGLTLPQVNRQAIGFSPVDCVGQSFVFSQPLEGYERKKQARTVYLTSYLEGRIKAFLNLDKIKNLKSFFQLSLRVKEGGSLTKTTNYFTAPGFLTLISENQDQILEDYQNIRLMEENHEIFAVE